MPIPAHQELARAIVAAARRREESFDHGMAASLQRRGTVSNLHELYKLSIQEASEVDGVNPFLSHPVYLLLSQNWNAALDWAEANK